MMGQTVTCSSPFFAPFVMLSEIKGGDHSDIRLLTKALLFVQLTYVLCNANLKHSLEHTEMNHTGTALELW